jgi:predicted lipase
MVFCLQSIPTAHTGFLQRARAVNVEHLHEVAKSKGKRLVLCGHSLGKQTAWPCLVPASCAMSLQSNLLPTAHVHIKLPQ